jgi:Icc-related predicted phosphoesterase
MQLQVFSDLHLESCIIKPVPKKADVVVLAGDIHVGTAGIKWAKKTFRNCPVIYVLGNHEFYNHTIPDLLQDLRREAKGSNVHVLENKNVEIGGFVFLGCSLWTDFQIWPDAAEAMRFANQEMNDFWVIKKPDGNKMYSAEDSANRHAASVRWLTRRLARHDPARTIVVTHHAPSPWSISPKNALDMLNAAFASDLNPLIKASRIPLWIHGHTHYNVDYKIGATRIYSNQGGYRHEGLQGFEPGNVIEI